MGTNDSLLDDYAMARAHRKPYPTLQDTNRTHPSIASAYSTQKQWVHYLKQDHPITGYKLGLTSVSAQRQFNTNAPIFGVLMPDIIHSNFDIVYKKEFVNLKIEAEIGFTLARSVTKPLTSPKEVAALIRHIYPVIEFADIAFSSSAAPHITDLIMSNSGSKRYLLGTRLAYKDLRDLTVTVKKDTITTSQYTEKNRTTTHLDALMWAINTALEQGYTPSRNDLIITGALGNVLDGESGRYSVHYGNKTVILFEVR